MNKHIDYGWNEEALTALISSLNSRIEGLVKKVEELSARRKVAELYDLDDLSRLLKVSKRTLFNWRKQGILPLIDLGGRYFITGERLFAILEANPRMQKGGRHE